jgi:hypothetical protein
VTTIKTIRNMLNVKKGQKVYVHVNNSRDNDYYATVVSVGKKWIKIDSLPNDRFSVETGVRDNWGAYCLYESKEALQEAKDREYRLKVVERNAHRLGNILSVKEIEDLYNRLVQRYNYDV